MSGVVVAASAARGVKITLAASYNVVDLQFDPNDAYVEFRLESDNDIVTVEFSGDDDQGDWMVPRGGAPSSSYEVRATLNSGSAPGGSGTGTWLALSTTRFWSQSRTTPGGPVTSDLTIEIREAVSQVVVASCAVNLSATVEV